MMLHYYLLPIQVVRDDGRNYRGPSYLKWRKNPSGLVMRWSLKDFGCFDTVGLVAASGDSGDHNTLASSGSVWQFPEDLDTLVAASDLEAASNADGLSVYLERWGPIPGDWIAASHTYRQAVQGIARRAMYLQRLTGLLGGSPSGYDLDAQLSNVAGLVQTTMQTAACSLGHDFPSGSGQLTVRDLLGHQAGEWGDAPILFGFTSL